jgi:hypothetical protein
MAAKFKWEESQGSPPGVNGSWDFKNDSADFGGANLAAAGSVIETALALPQTTNLQQAGEYDPYPTPLAAASGTRVVGSSSQPMGLLTRAWIFARTSAGGLYQPAAGSTVTLDVVNASETAGAGNQVKTNIAAAVTLATFDLAFWNPLTFASFTGTDRAAARPDGTLVPSWMYLYAGDVVIATLTTTGALNVQGNSLTVVLEWV